MPRGLVQVAAGLVGIAIIACVADASINATGGYGQPAAKLIMALGAGLAVGSIAIGILLTERLWSLAACLVIALLAGEGFALLTTAERTVASREQQQAPLREREEARGKIKERVAEAEQSIIAAGAETPRLKRALALKATADAAVVAKAAEKGCAKNCRVLLEQQVVLAGDEIDAARAEIMAVKRKADGELVAARAALDATPQKGAVSPLADRLGVAGWKLDLTAAGLASLGANGLAAALIAFAAHGHRRREEAVPPPPAEIKTATARVKKVSAHDEADRFARAVFRPDAKGRVYLRDMRAGYHSWSANEKRQPLPDPEIGAALNALFGSVGLYREGDGIDAAIVGIAWKAAQVKLIGSSPKHEQVAEEQHA